MCQRREVSLCRTESKQYSGVALRRTRSQDECAIQVAEKHCLQKPYPFLTSHSWQNCCIKSTVCNSIGLLTQNIFVKPCLPSPQLTVKHTWSHARSWLCKLQTKMDTGASLCGEWSCYLHYGIEAISPTPPTPFSDGYSSSSVCLQGSAHALQSLFIRFRDVCSFFF